MALWMRIAVAALALVACDDKQRQRGPAEAPSANASSVVEALGIDAGALGEGIDPPAPAGDLRTEIERFTTLDACVADRSKVDPLIGDSLHAIGYDTFFRDTCRLLEAAKDKKREACERIDSSALRKQCRSWVAMIAQTPDECPLELDGLASRGRAPTCLAVAAKDPRLCTGEGRSAQRATCEALVQRDDKRCDVLLPSDRASCKRELARWRTLLAAPLEGLPKLAVSRGKLVVHGADGTMDPATTETSLASDFARGAVVVVGRGAAGASSPMGDRDARRARVELGWLGESESLHVAGSPNRRVRVGLAVLLDRAPDGRDDPKPVLERFELELPGEPPLVHPTTRCDCRFTTSRIDKTRGGEIALALEGTIRGGARAYKIELEAGTFVRDVVAEQAGGTRLLPPAHPFVGGGLGALDAGR